MWMLEIGTFTMTIVTIAIMRINLFVVKQIWMEDRKYSMMRLK